MDYEIMMNGNIKLGMHAPDFEANSTFGNISLEQFKGKWLVFFSHPGDFTPVCTTEMLAFSNAYSCFLKLNTNLLALSIDSNASHLAWVYEIYLRTGIKIPFPIIADRSGEISRKYGMIASDISNTSTVRNVFVIDDKGIIRAILIYPMNVGRYIPEILRLVDALQTADCTNSSTPANWSPEFPLIVSMPQTFEELLRRAKEIQENNNGFSWYLSFKEQTCKPCLKNNSISNCK